MDKEMKTEFADVKAMLARLLAAVRGKGPKNIALKLHFAARTIMGRGGP